MKLKSIMMVVAIAAISTISVSYALTKDAQDFLYTEGKMTDVPELDETNAIELIKKANHYDSDVFSSELQSLFKRTGLGNENPLLIYGAEPDCVGVNNPDIKIFKMIPNEDGEGIIVIFDFIDKEAPHMGWISKQDHHQKICAMSFIYENRKWVVDDYLEAWNSTVDKFNKNEASSIKSNLKFILEES